MTTQDNNLHQEGGGEPQESLSASLKRAGSYFKDERMSARTMNDNSSHGGGDNSSIHSHHNNKPSQGWGQGIVEDFRTTVGTHWWDEVKNFNFKTIAVSLFLFIAVIAPSITFGAVYAKRTNNYMGAVELLLGTGFCGVFYALVSGMPMMINGGTGPVLTFQALIYELSVQWDVPFLAFNAWVGLWVAFYMILSAVLDLNRFIQYATRFTDEIFAFLIISIFILDAIGNPTSEVGLMHYFNPDHKHYEDLEGEEDYDYLSVAFLSLFLGLGTTFVALALRSIKHSPFCCNDAARSAFTDFAITLSVVLWTFVKELFFADVPTEQLNVPDTFATTFTCCDSTCTSYWPDDCPDVAEPAGRRPWLVNLTDLNGSWWVALVAAGPAALAFILAFLDNGITWHIINHPSNKVTHGESYNYDTCVSAVMIAANSLLGLPWLVASTVPCMMHVQAMSERTKDGQVLRVQESRLTGFLTHVLVFLSLAFLSLIKLIPLPVLYGVFLFMGLVALPSQQFWQRILLFFMQPSHYPETPYTVFMEKNRIHWYTLVQLLFFGMLYMVKTIKAIAIAFPFFILLCIPARLYLLPRFFYEFELVVLDGSPEEVETFVRKWAIEADEQDNDYEEAKPLVTENDADDGSDKDNKGDDEQLPADENDTLDEDVVDVDAVTDHSEGEEADIFLGHNDAKRQEMLHHAKRRSGRHVRKKTVSDLSGMFQAPANETVWSHW